MSNIIFMHASNQFLTVLAEEQGGYWGLIHADQSVIVVVAIFHPALGDDIRSRRIKRTRTNICRSGETLQLAHA